MITKWKVKGNFKKENDRIKIIIQNNQYSQISKYIYHIYSTNLIRGWALINFFCLYDGRLFEVGANSRLGAYSKKYGTPTRFNLREKRAREGREWTGA